jgi:uncharacterized flavoprotein (TIGR03862 family)
MERRVRVVGTGPSGLMAADVLSAAGLAVDLWDHHKRPGRKFLLAGRGGLNLTHSEPLDRLLSRYGPDRDFLEPALRAFPPEALRAWCLTLGIDSFVGSTGRVFPVGLKASPLLRALLQRLAQRGVQYQPGRAWTGFDDVPTILALGGGSWPELGSNAGWVDIFRAQTISVVPLQASNARVRVAWSEAFAARFKGQPIKNVAARCGDVEVRGEVMIAEDGLEGGGVYALSRSLRAADATMLVLDLKPDLSHDGVAARLARRKPKDSHSTMLRKAFNLTPPAIGLMREVGATSPKRVVLSVEGMASLTRAISTAGGVAQHEVDSDFRLRRFPATQVVGEMLDWDAPTGGYLLQACFSTAFWAATRLAQRLAGGPAR